MYYITNQTGEIIAADSELLALFDAKNLRDLYKKVALEEIAFQAQSDEEVILQTNEGDLKYQTDQSKLSSILGELTIVHLTKEVPFVEQTETLANVPMQEKITSLQIDDDKLDIAATDEISIDLLGDNSSDGKDIDIGKLLKEAEEKSECNDALSLCNDETDEAESADFDTSESTQDDKSQDKEELFDLLLPDQASETIKEIAPAPDSPEDKFAEAEEPNILVISEDIETEPEDNSPIVININAISNQIGITADDYSAFLNEYIDTALSLEKDLQCQDNERRDAAIKTLSHLSDVLHLPKISDIMDSIGSADESSLHTHIASLYSTLSRLTTIQEEQIETVQEEEESPKGESIVLETSLGTSPSFAQGFGSIELNDVQPIHFDFRLEDAADDLGLPVELIEEFVNDFINQAKEETPKMLEAYKKGELETIQKIGHLLKGAASNLRIMPLSETLYDIQFCNDSSQLEPLIKNYWAHFLSFEKQMNTNS